MKESFSELSKKQSTTKVSFWKETKCTLIGKISLISPVRTAKGFHTVEAADTIQQGLCSKGCRCNPIDGACSRKSAHLVAWRHHTPCVLFALQKSISDIFRCFGNMNLCYDSFFFQHSNILKVEVVVFVRYQRFQFLPVSVQSGSVGVIYTRASTINQPRNCSSWLQRTQVSFLQCPWGSRFSPPNARPGNFIHFTSAEPHSELRDSEAEVKPKRSHVNHARSREQFRLGLQSTKIYGSSFLLLSSGWPIRCRNGTSGQKKEM